MNITINLKDPKSCQGCPLLQIVHIEEEQEMDKGKRTATRTFEEFYKDYYKRGDYCWCRYYTKAISPFHTKDYTSRTDRFKIEKGKENILKPLRPGCCLKDNLTP